MTDTTQKRIPVKCACGKEETSEYDKKFWSEKISMRNNPDVARIDGNHYIIGNGKRQLGMSGALHEIRFDDGRVVVTNDLWHQGRIPDDFRQVLQDNAVFIQ